MKAKTFIMWTRDDWDFKEAPECLQPLLDDDDPEDLNLMPVKVTIEPTTVEVECQECSGTGEMQDACPCCMGEGKVKRTSRKEKK